MQCRNIVHNDITSRNIIVSTNSDEDESTSIDFHLIHFGIAQQFHGTSSNTYRDASLIAEVLFCMMLKRPGADGFREYEPLYKEVLSAAQQPDWPYPRNLIEAIWDLHDFEFRSGLTYQVAIPTGRMWKWWKQFSNELGACKVNAAQAGRKEALRIQRPIQDPRLMLFTDFVPLTKGGGPACCPLRKAEINTETLKVLKVSEVEVWGEYFASECWKSESIIDGG